MNVNRLWTLGSAVTIIAVVLLGWVVGILPQLNHMGAADQSRARVQSENLMHKAELAALKEQYATLGELKTKLAGLQDALPATAEISDFLNQLSGFAADTGVQVAGLTVGDARGYAPAVTTAAPSAASAPSPAASGATPAPTPAPTSTPASAPAPAAVAQAPVIAPVDAADAARVDGANFIAIPIQISLTGDYQKTMDFISQLQSGTRLFLVTTLNVTNQPDPTTGAVGSNASTVGGFVYVLLDPTAKAAVITK